MPSKSLGVKEATPSTTGARLPDIDYAGRREQRAVKSRRELHPRSKTNIGNVISMGLKTS